MKKINMTEKVYKAIVALFKKNKKPTYKAIGLIVGLSLEGARVHVLKLLKAKRITKDKKTRHITGVK